MATCKMEKCRFKWLTLKPEGSSFETPPKPRLQPTFGNLQQSSPLPLSPMDRHKRAYAGLPTLPKQVLRPQRLGPHLSPVSKSPEVEFGRSQAKPPARASPKDVQDFSFISDVFPSSSPPNSQDFSSFSSNGLSSASPKKRQASFFIGDGFPAASPQNRTNKHPENNFLESPLLQSPCFASPLDSMQPFQQASTPKGLQSVALPSLSPTSSIGSSEEQYQSSNHDSTNSVVSPPLTNTYKPLELQRPTLPILALRAQEPPRQQPYHQMPQRQFTRPQQTFPGQVPHLAPVSDVGRSQQTPPGRRPIPPSSRPPPHLPYSESQPGFSSFLSDGFPAVSPQNSQDFSSFNSDAYAVPSPKNRQDFSFISDGFPAESPQNRTYNMNPAGDTTDLLKASKFVSPVRGCTKFQRVITDSFVTNVMFYASNKPDTSEQASAKKQFIKTACSKQGTAKFISVDCAKECDLCRFEDVKCTPTYRLYKDGKMFLSTGFPN